MPNEVPTRQLKAANLSQHFFSIHGLEVFLLGLVRTGSKPYLSFDHRDMTVSKSDLIAGIDDGSCTDNRCVGQIPSRDIGKGSDGGVLATRGVVDERTVSDGGVVDACSVTSERIDSDGGVEVACAVPKVRIDSVGGVETAGGVANERIAPLPVLWFPVVLLRSEAIPLSDAGVFGSPLSAVFFFS